MKKLTTAVLAVLPVLIVSAGLLLAVKSPGIQNSMPQVAEKGGWMPLVNGIADTTTSQFVGFGSSGFPASGWTVEADGSLHGHGGGDLISKDSYGDFEMELEWKVAPDGNSGVFYRVKPMPNQPIYQNAFECQIYGPADLTKVHPVYRPGALYNLYGNESLATVKPVGQWNTMRILVQGNHVRHYLNGAKVVDAQLGSADYLAHFKHSKFAKVPGYGTQTSGPIGLQSDGGEVWYRDVKIRRL